MLNNLIPKKVLIEFFRLDKIKSISLYGNGLINQTYLVEFEHCKYLVQKTNTNVFTNPFGVINNIKEVSDYIRSNIIYSGEDPQSSVLTIVQTRYKQDLVMHNDDCWRCFRFIDNAISYDLAPNTYTFEEAGRIIGEFQKLLEGFHTRILFDTIKDFHNTPVRFETFKDSVKLDRCNRASLCINEIKYILNHEDRIKIIQSLLNNHEIPRRVTHNDTKLNNIMFSKDDGRALCLVDLDTVMKGSLLYDYGDALRTGANKTIEDDTNLDNVLINFEMFEAFNKGYLRASKGIITDKELDHLIDGFFIITLETGMRFLTDFLDGDKYFELKEEDKFNRPYKNLERAKNQLKLACEIELHEEELKKIINDTLIKEGYEHLI